MSFEVSVNFIDQFKIGDNINFNLEILAVLYDGYANLQDGKKLIKPIVLLNTAIIEAVLFDFVVNRLKRPYRSEILFENISSILKDVNLKKFEHYITQIEKYDLFELKDTNFYNAIRSLSKKRNRIHIQNDKRDEPLDESNIFNDKLKILSEKVLEKILFAMSNKYPRRNEYHKYVKDFILPWDQHFI
jgi:hypothetical protein